jgi:Rrf2 family protein
VRKVLKTLAHHGLLEAHRGVKGGFTLVRKPEEISLAEIIEALEGPIAFTKCSTREDDCRLERVCPVRGNWQRINRLMLGALRGISLAEMARQLDGTLVELGGNNGR